MDYHIAKREDLPEIVRIYNSIVAGRMVTADLEEVSVEQRIPWFEQHDPEKRPLWVFEEDGKMIGWLSFQSFYGRIAYDATVEVSIYIDASVRGKGWGSKILTFAIAQAPYFHIETLLGFIFAHNEPSIKIFEKFGFQIWADLPDVAELDGVKRSLLILGKKV